MLLFIKHRLYFDITTKRDRSELLIDRMLLLRNNRDFALFFCLKLGLIYLGRWNRTISSRFVCTRLKLHGLELKLLLIEWLQLHRSVLRLHLTCRSLVLILVIRHHRDWRLKQVFFRVRHWQWHPQASLGFNCLLFFNEVNRLQIPSICNSRRDLVMLIRYSLVL